MTKLAAAFPASFGDEVKVNGVAVLWAELLQAHPWITRDIFVTGVYELAWGHKSEYLPEPATALDFFRLARDKVERETQKALPAPAPKPDRWGRMTGPERAAFLERHIAIGRLRRAAGATDLSVPFEASEQAIAGMLGQQRAMRFMWRQLERVAAGEPVSPADLLRGVRE